MSAANNRHHPRPFRTPTQRVHWDRGRPARNERTARTTVGKNTYLQPRQLDTSLHLVSDLQHGVLTVPLFALRAYCGRDARGPSKKRLASLLLNTISSSTPNPFHHTTCFTAAPSLSVLLPVGSSETRFPRLKPRCPLPLHPSWPVPVRALPLAALAW